MAANRTINNIEYKGAIIKEKAQGGYQVGDNCFASLKGAKALIDEEIKSSFDALFNIMGIVCSRFPNCLIYEATEASRDNAVKETNSLIYQMRLPLVVEVSTYSKKTFIVKYNPHG